MKRRSLYSAVYAAAYNSFATASPQKSVQQRRHRRWKQAARRAACLPIVFAALLAAAGGSLAADKSAKIGVLTDLSGPYSDLGGLGSVVAAEMAVNDSGLRGKGWSVTVVAADHMNKPDVGVNAVRKWLEADDVDAIADVNNSGVALAVNAIIKERNGVYLASGSATSDLTGKACTPNTIQWTYDTYEFASGTGRELTRAGGKSWFFISADYAFGAALERDASEVIRANGGHVTGSVKHPLNAGDFSSWLLQAQASKADIIGLANAGSDVHNAIKQAVEFGIPAGGQKLAALFFLIADVQALGLEKTQGLFVTETFYWDLNAGTRAFAKRFAQKAPKHFMPTMI